jgi:hypothetical protein
LINIRVEEHVSSLIANGTDSERFPSTTDDYGPFLWMQLHAFIFVVILLQIKFWNLNCVDVINDDVLKEIRENKINRVLFRYHLEFREKGTHFDKIISAIKGGCTHHQT